MDTSSTVPLKDQKEKPSIVFEVVNVEKQLWASINAKGLLHSDVQALYRNVCASYEKILLGDHDLAELQDVEYSLWKLHYRHIDEFRKRMKRSSTNDTAKTKIPQSVAAAAAHRSNDDHRERFKSFLSEATEFYQNMMAKFRRLHGLPEDKSFYCLTSAIVEPMKMKKMQFLCHRFLVCLGDLARYREQCEHADIQNQNWSISVTHYLEATKIWPESGNPQNQLAVLATYVGDEFLALHHCIRSLAVKEPFPDAWNNLILLFERNRSSSLRSLSSEAQFNFLKPSEHFQTKLQSTSDLTNCKMIKAEHEGTSATDLWPLMIRMIGLFFIKSSIEEFPCTFASTINELDGLVTVDDSKLRILMESYKSMGSVRSGPFRTLQIVCIFIFVIEDLINSPEVKESKNSDDPKQFVLTQLALTATFIFMGRLADRCLKANLLDACTLLPGLLVFVEWLVNILDEVEKYGCDDDKIRSAMSYFFCSFLELLKQCGTAWTEDKHLGTVALWEDYELRGFAPLARSHASLDFSSHWENADSYESGADSRAFRITRAAMKIADLSNSNRKWLLYDKSTRIFFSEGSDKSLEEKETENVVLELKSPSTHVPIVTEEHDKLIHADNPSNTQGVGKSVSVEEEEVILFTPLTRHNSAPLYGSFDDGKTPKETGDLTVPADECLRRATSLLIAQNQAQGNPSFFQSDLTNFKRNKPMKQQEFSVKDATGNQFSEPSVAHVSPSMSPSISAGPPSLNAWVVSRGTFNNDRAKGKNDTSKHVLPPIEEIASTSLNGLSINGTDAFISPGNAASANHYYSSSPYSIPVPSAPLLPDDAVWFSGVQPTFPEYNSSGSISRPTNFLDASQVGGYSRWNGTQLLPANISPAPGFTNGYAPTSRLTSSEWLRQYREKNNLERTPNHSWPVYSYAVGPNGNFLSHDIGSSMSGVYDQWGTPLASTQLNYEGNPTLHMGFPPAYGTDDQRIDKLFQGYQRPSPYVCGTVNESEPLLQYLKEKEWLLQQDPALRGPTYMGN